MRSSVKTFFAAILDALCIYIGVYGILFGIITAYGIKTDKESIIYVSLLAASAFSSLFYAVKYGKYKIVVLISASAVCLVLFLVFYRDISNGFSLFLGMLTQRMSSFSDAISPTKSVALSAVGRIRAYTVFFSFLGVLLSALLALAVIRLRSLWTAVFISIPVFSVCLFFVKEVPDIGPVVAFFVFLTSIILAGSVRRGEVKKGAGMLTFFLPLTLAFLLVVNAAFPDSPDNRSVLANKMYSFFSEVFPITLNHPPQNISIDDDSSYYDESSWSYTSTDESSGSPIDGGPKMYQRLDLTGESPNFSGAVVMRVRSFEVGPLLLRGFSLDSYNGVSWVVFDDGKQRNLDDMIEVEPFSDLLESGSLVNSMSFATYVAITTRNAVRNDIGVSEVNSGGEIIYTPYFPLLANYNDFTYYNSSVILHTQNAYTTDKVRASYTITSYNSEELFSAVHSTNNDRQSEQYARITELENTYRHYAYEYYTEISDSTERFLQGYISGEDFYEIQDRAALVDAVTKFVKNSAKYNLKVPKTPRGTDFVEHFLSDSRQGYCVHFATAATLIFRTLGVPARYVSGYSLDFKEDQAGKWKNVLDKNAHSWVEVYFDGIGWVPVDVTPSEPSGSGNSSDSGVSLESSDTESSGTSGEVSVSSEPYSSGEHSSEYVSSNTSSSDPTPIPRSKMPFWIYGALFGVLTLVSIALRRRGICKARRKDFEQSDINKAVVSAWMFIERLIPYGLVYDNQTYETAQKAAFSKHILSEEERRSVVDFALKKAEEIDKGLSFFRRMILRYIRALH